MRKKKTYPELRLQIRADRTLTGDQDTLIIPIEEAIKIYLIQENMIKIRQYVQEYFDGRIKE